VESGDVRSVMIVCDKGGRERKAGNGWHHLVDREGSAGSLNCLSISFPFPHTEWRIFPDP